MWVAVVGSVKWFPIETVFVVNVIIVTHNAFGFDTLSGFTYICIFLALSARYQVVQTGKWTERKRQDGLGLEPEPTLLLTRGCKYFKYCLLLCHISSHMSFVWKRCRCKIWKVWNVNHFQIFQIFRRQFLHHFFNIVVQILHVKM